MVHLVDRSFSLVIFEKNGFGKCFLKWSQIFINNQESCIMNGGVTIKYFNLNLFVPNALFLYPLRRSENLTGFCCFQGAEKGCIWNEGVNRRARQGDLISVLLLIFALEASFVLIKSSNDVKDLDIYDHNFLYTIYADDSIFSLGT